MTYKSIGSIKKQVGFSLVELVIALVVGLIVILAASQVYIVMRENFQTVFSINDRQADIAFIADTLSRDIRNVRRNGSHYLCSDSEAVDSGLDVGVVDGKCYYFLYEPSIDGSFYCSEGEELSAVAYYQNEEMLYVAARCNGAWKAGNEVVRSLVPHSFDLRYADPRLIQVEVGFQDRLGILDDYFLKFAVANRDLVVSQTVDF